MAQTPATAGWSALTKPRIRSATANSNLLRKRDGGAKVVVQDANSVRPSLAVDGILYSIPRRLKLVIVKCLEGAFDGAKEQQKEDFLSILPILPLQTIPTSEAIQALSLQTTLAPEILRFEGLVSKLTKAMDDRHIDADMFLLCASVISKSKRTFVYVPIDLYRPHFPLSLPYPTHLWPRSSSSSSSSSPLHQSESLSMSTMVVYYRLVMRPLFIFISDDATPSKLRDSC
ncbi:uncharacterized protein MYCFIDRAFT_174660 [Pseudocercospora fijiensis CIRAD86]|uniref:Uncharacterized protein n=1 Tax=Pseudocercospora fijiensis (strain CIRAD86) TaxID=383855 RepID=M2YZZ1_PSEFD|nr:uncharacterized protein MYCFIDRAFT_174660 [Pseudocercospora fijiensis CIRAD86]EME83180.1 hypothetical protein MYCFIDRAFT_174660 [Pseudocercospora fijiensis CIRAD86]